MTREEAQSVIMTEQKCVNRANCNRDCANCDLVMDDAVINEALSMAIAALEQLEPCEDAVSRKAVLDINTQYHGQMPNELNHQIWKDIKALPSAQPEPLTDKEQRIFLAAMGREEKVCKYKDSLVKTCHEIIRKVKGALWT